MNNRAYRGVAVFHAQEKHIEAQPGEWLRDDALSSKDVGTLANEWCQQHGCWPVQVSPPTVQFAGETKSADGCRMRTYNVSISLIYAPKEVIDYGENQPPQEEITLSRSGALSELFRALAKGDRT